MGAHSRGMDALAAPDRADTPDRADALEELAEAVYRYLDGETRGGLFPTDIAVRLRQYIQPTEAKGYIEDEPGSGPDYLPAEVLADFWRPAEPVGPVVGALSSTLTEKRWAA